jgi:hypothetical protein
MGKFKFYTDGIKTIKVKENEIPPVNFYPGRTFNHKSWNKGLTKADPRVAASIEKGRQTRLDNDSYQSWNKGLTKEINESLRKVSEKVSLAKKGKPSWNKGIPASEERKKKQSESMKGNIPYNKGLNKEINKSLKSASDKLLGHKCFVTDWEAAKAKEYETKKRNNSFNTSKPEEEYYIKLCEEYGKHNVLRQFRDSRYPFNCDFYIKSEDLFIELHYSWTHCYEPYDSDNPQHQELLKDLVKKSETSSYYRDVIYCWTDLDVRKLMILRQNNLNFNIIYPNLIITN